MLLVIYFLGYLFVSECCIALKTLVLVWYWVYMIFDYHQYYTNISTLVLVLNQNTPRIAHPC